MSLSYQSYLQLDKLLACQEPRSEGPEHDELLFIIVHQVYELWFKQILHELNMVQSALERGDEANVFHGFKRILSILKTLVAQIDILETMTPVAFNSFRDRLDTASGFQSYQFREFEFVLGKRSRATLKRFSPASDHYQRLAGLLERPSLWDSFVMYLGLNGYSVPDELRNRDFAESPPSSPALQEILVEIYQKRSVLMQVCERLIDLDEGLQEWRYRHVKMVERTIGMKRGTGGSSGVDYLKETVFKPLFPDLWAIRIAL